VENTLVKAEIGRSRCDVSLSESPATVDVKTVRFTFTASKNLDSWFTKQFKIGQPISDTGASSSTDRVYLL
jgi:hypothetical protein